MKRLWIAALALLVPMALYTTGITSGQPRPEFSPSTTQHAWLNPSNVFHPDEFAYVGIPYRMLLARQWNPHYYHNPSLNLYTNMVFFWLSGADGLPHNLDYGDREIAPFTLYVMARGLSALFTLLTVALTYAVGRAVFGRRAGVLAAGLVALSPLTVQHAHYAIPSAQTTLLATASLLMAALILTGKFPRLPQWGIYGLAGLLVGLTMAARYNAAVVGVITGLVFVNAWYRQRHWVPVIAGFAAMPLGFALGTPGILFATREVIDQVRDILDWYRVRGGGSGFTTDRGLSGLAYHWRYTALIAIGLPGMVAALLGLGLALRHGQRSRDRHVRWFSVMLVVYVAVYSLLALQGRRLQANLLFPLIAPLALLSGYGVLAGWQGTGQGRWTRYLFVFMLLICPAALSLLFAYRISVPDNRLRAQEWVYAHIPRGTRVHLLGPYNVPLDPADYRVTQTFAGEADPETLRAMNVQVIVYSDAHPYLVLRDRALSAETDIAREEGIRTLLRTEWRTLKRFGRMPWPAETLSPDDVSYWHQMEIVIYCNPADCPVQETGVAQK